MANKKDYYEVLGISKGSTDKEIKAAFKKLAKKYHPDISKEENAEEKFKEIQEAYAILSDSQKRAQYDQFGHAAFDQMGGGSAGFEGFDFSDIFSEIFGGGFGGFGGFGDFGGFGGGFSSSNSDPNAPRPGRDMEMTINLTFKEAIHGVEKKYSIKRDQDCKTCDGKGAKSASDIKECDMCHGEGKVRQQQQTMLGMAITESVCPKCHGKGKEIKNPCNTCHGSGRHKYSEDITIKIPKGADNGSYMKVPSKGEAGINGAPSGTLYLKINVEENKYFKRDDLDIRLDIPITYSQAVLGDKIKVPTVYGEVEFTIPSGTKSDTIFKLKGQGIQIDTSKLFGKSKGDQYVKVKIQTPKKLNKEEKEIIKKLHSYDEKHLNYNEFLKDVKSEL